MWQQKPKKPQNLQIFSTKLKALMWIPVIKKKATKEQTLSCQSNESIN